VALRPRGSGYIDIGNRLSPDEERSAATNPADPRLQWQTPDSPTGTLWQVGSRLGEGAWGGPPEAGSIQGSFEQGLADRVPQLFPETNGVGDSLWYVWGSTPDGSQLVVGEKWLDPDPSRVYGVLRSPSGQLDVAARWTDVDGPLPVAVPLLG
jgi:hypothetical protein